MPADDMGRDAAAGGFDFGQFRHDMTLSPFDIETRGFTGPHYSPMYSPVRRPAACGDHRSANGRLHLAAFGAHVTIGTP